MQPLHYLFFHAQFYLTAECTNYGTEIVNNHNDWPRHLEKVLPLILLPKMVESVSVDVWVEVHMNPCDLCVFVCVRKSVRICRSQENRLSYSIIRQHFREINKTVTRQCFHERLHVQEQSVRYCDATCFDCARKWKQIVNSYLKKNNNNVCHVQCVHEGACVLVYMNVSMYSSTQECVSMYTSLSTT